MDREFIVTWLFLATAAPALWTWNSRPAAIGAGESARAAEARCWQAIWWSTWPLLVAVASVIRWWIAMPDLCPSPPKTIMIAGALYACVLGRAVVRARRSSRIPPAPAGPATVGLWRSRIVMPDGLRDRLPPAVRRAAAAHEAAHVRHRDPLRIWIAQLATDLQWPWPWARRRFAVWRHALELARDEEARLGGVSGDDLAAAIVAVARCERLHGAAALLAGDTEAELLVRIARLLSPVPPCMLRPGGAIDRYRGFVLVAGGVCAALLFGQAAVQAALHILP